MKPLQLYLVLTLSLYTKLSNAATLQTAPLAVNVTLLAPTSALVSWSTLADDANSSTNASSLPLRYEVTYRPVKERVRTVAAVGRGLTSFLLTDLRPGTIYSITVTSINRRRRLKSPSVVLLVPPQTGITIGSGSGSVPGSVSTHFQVRAEEVGIVLVVLAVWVAAITLFFHRWGKIRMLLPYQPEYKEECRINSGSAIPSIPPLPQQQQIPCVNTPIFGTCTGYRPASMSRLDSLDASRNRYSPTLTTSSRRPASCSQLCRLPRKTKSAEVITLTVTQCADSITKAEQTTECAF